MSAPRIVLIWSIEHQRWWRPGRLGYTGDLAEAGHYRADEAAAILARANLVAVQECAIPLACVAPEGAACDCLTCDTADPGGGH
jgi:hypothetical protein